MAQGNPTELGETAGSSPTLSRLGDSAPRGSSVRLAVLTLVVAVAAATTVTARFSPRFALWRGLSIAGDLPSPAAEFDRAVVSLAQLDDPWAPVNHPYHMVVGWRKLFPFVGHYLHLSHGMYLVLPHIGCLFALWLTAALTYRRVGHWFSTFVITATFAALPWFFVSSSWLTHFDSWLMLGLLVAAFVRSRAALTAMCLLMPWIDERFLLCLPATLAVRAVALGQIERRAWAELRGDLVIAIAASVPYPAIRAVSWYFGDPNSSTYVRNHWAELPTVPWYRFVDGFWSGYRVAWLLIAVGTVLAARRVGWRFAAMLALVEFGTAVCGLFIAWDMSRSMMMIAPMLVLSMWLWEEWRGERADASQMSLEPVSGPTRELWTFRWRRLLLASFLPAVLVANLIVPAYHMLWATYWPVQPFYIEYGKWHNPPNLFRAAEHLQNARRLKEEHHIDAAIAELNEALQYEANYPLALIERAVLRTQTGDLAGAEDDCSAAVQSQADYPYAFLLRGALRSLRGERQGAAADFRQALAIAPPNWEFREEATRRLTEVTQ
jgi:hypothetical protein